MEAIDNIWIFVLSIGGFPGAAISVPASTALFSYLFLIAPDGALPEVA
jgi:hypothetical protein